MRAAFASVVCIVVMLLVILLGAETGSGWIWIAVLWLGLLSVFFALVAVGGALWGKDESDRRLLPLLIAVPILFAVGGTIVGLFIAFANSFE